MKNFNPEEPSKGLGDSIAKLTHALGIDKLVDKVARALGQEDCGCERRREVLNKIVPYIQVDSADYIFKDSRYFEVVEEADIVVGDEEITYNKGDKVLISPAHKLYPILKQLLSQQILKKL